VLKDVLPIIVTHSSLWPKKNAKYQAVLQIILTEASSDVDILCYKEHGPGPDLIGNYTKIAQKMS
jgi:hypothetical protein